ncbi:MAG: DUF6048 family protein [Bacteroidales bacterium]
MVRRISASIISLLSLAVCTVQSQEAKYLRLGLDLIPPVSSFFLDGRRGLEAQADLEFKKNYFLVVEPGFLSASYSDSTFSYKSHGNYLRLGIEKNFLQNPKFKGNEVITIGLRYGISHMQNSASDILIPASYWNQMPNWISVPEQSFWTHWIEVKAGIKAELVKNLFIGWSIAGRVMLKSGHTANMTPYLIPGFGRGDRKTNAGFNYYIAYRIPFSKRQELNGKP